MSSLNLRPLRRLMAALLWLPLACACSSSDSGDITAPLKPEIATSNHYINLNIVVSSGSEGTMRVPTADGTNPDWEDGDGREQGINDRENKVTGITFMLYPVADDTKGINESQDTKLAFVQYYPVTKADPEECDYKDKDEAVYTTGIQPLKGLDLAQAYRAIVIANRDMTDIFTLNTTVKAVCEKTLEWIYTGSGMGVNASNFVMSSENDGDVIKFENPTENKPTADGETAIIYEPTTIHIERMAARVDFWMKNAKYVDESSDFKLETPGYLYDVYKNEKDDVIGDEKFVLTAVTPFNLYNNSAEEYLLKKLRDDDGLIKSIVPETRTNNVIDPKTVKKTSGASSDYNNPLYVLIGYDRDNKTLASANGYFKSTKDLYENKTTPNSQLVSIEDIDNFILCYPKENTLEEASPLYYYATGVAIEGDYYTKNATTGNYESEHRVYYGFLRHRGEKSGIYQIQAETAFADNKENDFSAINNTPMNFGVVRNNIYRISIDRITEKKDLELTIRVKKWDKFTHDIIYM